MGDPNPPQLPAGPHLLTRGIAMKLTLRLAVLVAVIVLAVAWAGPALAKPSAAPLDSFSLAQRAIELTNEQRAAAGLAPLAWNGNLASSAAAYAQDMAARDYFSHHSPEGTTPVDRNRDAGYPSQWWGLYVGENLARGYTSSEDVMVGWMASESHRANVLRPEWMDIGIGIAVAPNGTVYWAQEFGSRPVQ